MKTAKQIADALGLPKQRVYRYITTNHIKEAGRSGQCFVYDEAAQTRITEGLTAKNEVVRSTSKPLDDAVQDVIQLLQQQLEQKDKQIDDLNARLAESNAALVSAQKSAEAAQALHAGTLQKMLTEGTTEKPRRRWPWQRKDSEEEPQG